MANQKRPNTKSGKRLRELIQSLKMTYADFGDSVNLSERTINAYVTGERRVTEDNARIITEKYPIVRYEWLLGWDDYRTDDDWRVGNFLLQSNEIRREPIEYQARWESIKSIVAAMNYRLDTERWAEITEEDENEQRHWDDYLHLRETIMDESNDLLSFLFSPKELLQLRELIASQNELGGENEEKRKVMDEAEMKAHLEMERERMGDWKVTKSIWAKFRENCIYDSNHSILVKFTPEEAEDFVNRLYEVISAMITYEIVKRKER